MHEIEFQAEVIDRLARIETKQDLTNGRVTKLESKVHSLELTRAGHRGASRLLLGIIGGGTGLLGGILGAVIERFWR